MRRSAFSIEPCVARDLLVRLVPLVPASLARLPPSERRGPELGRSKVHPCAGAVTPFFASGSPDNSRSAPMRSCLSPRLPVGSARTPAHSPDEDGMHRCQGTKRAAGRDRNTGCCQRLGSLCEQPAPNPQPILLPHASDRNHLRTLTRAASSTRPVVLDEKPSRGFVAGHHRPPPLPLAIPSLQDRGMVQNARRGVRRLNNRVRFGPLPVC